MKKTTKTAKEPNGPELHNKPDWNRKKKKEKVQQNL